MEFVFQHILKANSVESRPSLSCETSLRFSFRCSSNIEPEEKNWAEGLLAHLYHAINNKFTNGSILATPHKDDKRFQNVILERELSQLRASKVFVCQLSEGVYGIHCNLLVVMASCRNKMR